jgi:putative ABC transport system substrate-binding protein
VSLTDDGMLMSNAQETDAILNRAGFYVAEILRGVDPGTLPIEQPTIFRLIINMKTVNALGLTAPASALARVDEVIE